MRRLPSGRAKTTKLRNNASTTLQRRPGKKRRCPTDRVAKPQSAKHWVSKSKPSRRRFTIHRERHKNSCKPSGGHPNLLLSDSLADTKRSRQEQRQSAARALEGFSYPMLRAIWSGQTLLSSKNWPSLLNLNTLVIPPTAVARSIREPNRAIRKKRLLSNAIARADQSTPGAARRSGRLSRQPAQPRSQSAGIRP